MEAGKRIVVNMIAQYSRAIINTCLSLYSVRLFLDILGASDYGIYSVIGGIIAMMGFITNALVITTQRYISFYHGRGEQKYVKQLFKNSLFLHFVIAISLFIVFIVLRDCVVYHLLNIPDGRHEVASKIYIMSGLMLVITILTAPFKALFIARENIVFISIVEVADGILKVLLAYSLTLITLDKLFVFSMMMTSVLSLNLAAYMIYALTRFEECSIFIRKRDISKQIQKQLAGFAGWTTYGMGAIACRTQGAAVLLNIFFGTIINAAYGIANQVYGSIVFVSSSVLNAMNPQIMKAEGAHDRKRMLRLAGQQSKFSAALMMIIAIPVMVEMGTLLPIWLKNVPPYTVMFCRFILIAFICDQLTIGLNAANQATGQIRTYTLLMFTPKLLFLPIAWLLLKNGGSPTSIMWLFLIIELGVSLMRLPFLHRTAGLDIKQYIADVVIPLLPLCLASTVSAVAIATWIDIPLRFILNIIISIAIGGFIALTVTLNREERYFLKHFIHKKRHADNN